MPGNLLHLGATVMCLHGGQAQPTAPNPRVTVGGQQIVTQTAPYSVAGCPFVPPSGTGPCTTAQWVTASVRVLAQGAPVVLQDSQATCVPTSTGLNVLATQVRVRAS